MKLDIVHDALDNANARDTFMLDSKEDAMLSAKTFQIPVPVAGRSKSELVRTRILLSAAAVVSLKFRRLLCC